MAESARSLLALTFEMVAKAIVDLRHVAKLLAATDNTLQPEEAAGLLGNSEMIETALRETIKVLKRPSTFSSRNA